jgi:CheY-like chemotaxis protein
MAHAFDARGFGQFLGDAERLFAGARDYERRLTSLVSLLEGDNSAALASSGDRSLMTLPPRPIVGPAPADVTATAELAVTVARQLSACAAEQRQLAQTMVAHLVGDSLISDGSRPHAARVLVVDDSDESRDVTAAILEDAGFDAMTAANGLEGVIVAHYARPPVVLMDVTMPVLNGVEAARLIYASAVTRDLKVIAYTARTEGREEPSSRWFAAVLPKPSSPDSIVATVREFAGSPR